MSDIISVYPIYGTAVYKNLDIQDRRSMYAYFNVSYILASSGLREDVEYPSWFIREKLFYSTRKEAEYVAGQQKFEGTYFRIRLAPPVNIGKRLNPEQLALVPDDGLNILFEIYPEFRDIITVALFNREADKYVTENT